LSQSNEQLLRGLYGAQAKGDIERYLSFLSDDVVMHVPGRSQIAGDYNGKDEVRRHFREMAQLSDGTFRTSVDDILASDQHAVGVISAFGKKDGRQWSLPRIHFWLIREERLAERWVYPKDQYAFDDYWGTDYHSI
jgi:uncharacterized protein